MASHPSSFGSLFGRLLKEHRTRRSFTLRRLAEAAACAEVTLRKIEAGARHPSTQMAHALADALALDAVERDVFLCEARSHAARRPPIDLHARLLAIAEDATQRYPDEVQHAELDELEERFDEVSGVLLSLMRTSPHDAQRFAGALCEFWQKRSRMTEGFHLLEQVLLLDLSPTEERARALLAAGTVCACRDDFTRGRRYIDECLHIAETLRIDDLIARAVHVAAWLSLWDGESQDACIARYEDAVRRFESLGDVHRSAHARCDLAQAHIFGKIRRFDVAEHCVRTGLAQFLAVDSRSGTAFAHHTLTIICAESGRYEEAERFESEALATFRRIGGPRDIAWSLAHLGEVAQARGQLEQSAAYWEEALDSFLKLGERSGIGIALHSLARIARENGQVELAQRKIIAGLRLASDWSRPFVFVHGLYELAGLRLAAAAPADAALLIGAADALVARHDMGEYFHAIRRFEEWRSSTCAHLGEQDFTMLAQRGASLSPDDALAAIQQQTAA
jgi:tetratricopeptide (TPR) repeat protein